LPAPHTALASTLKLPLTAANPQERRVRLRSVKNSPRKQAGRSASSSVNHPSKRLAREPSARQIGAVGSQQRR
jgi:hypothetical protein